METIPPCHRALLCSVEENTEIYINTSTAKIFIAHLQELTMAGSRVTILSNFTREHTSLRFSFSRWIFIVLIEIKVDTTMLHEIAGTRT